MGLLEGGGNQEVKVRVGTVSQQWFLGSAHCVLRSAFSLTAGIRPYCSSSMRGQQGSPHRPRPRVALRVLAMGVLVELFAGSGLYGDGKSCVLQGQLHRTADMREGHLSFSTLSSSSEESPP